MIRIVLVDDHPLFRSGFRTFLSLQPDMEVVGEAANGAEALAIVGMLRPDVVLMDVQMPVLDGVAATRRMRAAYPDVNIILCTTFDADGDVLEGVRAGAVRYVLKDAEDDAIVEVDSCGEHAAIEPAVSELGRLARGQPRTAKPAGRPGQA